MANFEAQYATPPSREARNPLMEEMLTISPDFCLRIVGSAAAMQL
jgi:hypothetical protein